MHFYLLLYEVLCNSDETFSGQLTAMKGDVFEPFGFNAELTLPVLHQYAEVIASFVLDLCNIYVYVVFSCD